MAECTACQLVYSQSVPSDEELSRTYDELYGPGGGYQGHLAEVDALRRNRPVKQGYFRRKVFLNRFSPTSGDLLLEVGCGVGSFLATAKSRGWDVLGVDLSQVALDASRHIHGLPVLQGRIEDLELPAGTVRAVVAWECLEHMADPRSFLQRVDELLRDDGVFACSVPNEGKKRVRLLPTSDPLSRPPLHLNFWSPVTLRKFAEVNGFKVDYMCTRWYLRYTAGANRNVLRTLLLQFGVLLGLYEGVNIFAVFSKNPGAG